MSEVDVSFTRRNPETDRSVCRMCGDDFPADIGRHRGHSVLQCFGALLDRIEEMEAALAKLQQQRLEEDNLRRERGER